MQKIDPRYSKNILSDGEYRYEVWRLMSGYEQYAGGNIIDPDASIIIINPETYLDRTTNPQLVNLGVPVAALSIRRLGKEGQNNFDDLLKIWASAIALQQDTLERACIGFEPGRDAYFDRPLTHTTTNRELLPILGFSSFAQYYTTGLDFSQRPQQSSVLTTCRGHASKKIGPVPTMELYAEDIEAAAEVTTTRLNSFSQQGLMGKNHAYHQGMIALAAAFFTEKGLDKYQVVEGDIILGTHAKKIQTHKDAPVLSLR